MPDLARKLISTERMMLAQVFLEKGCIVPQHSHENEQLTYILEGKLRFWLGEDESEVVDVGPGEVLHLPSGSPTRPRRWRRPSTSTSSAHRGRTGSTAPTRTCARRLGEVLGGGGGGGGREEEGAPNAGYRREDAVRAPSARR